MKKLLSLSLLLSLSMASFSPLLAAAQQASKQSITKSSGFQAALKKVRGQQLTPNEQAAYETLIKKVGRAFIIYNITLMLGMTAYQVKTLLSEKNPASLLERELADYKDALARARWLNMPEQQIQELESAIKDTQKRLDVMKNAH